MSVHMHRPRGTMGLESPDVEGSVAIKVNEFISHPSELRIADQLHRQRRTQQNATGRGKSGFESFSDISGNTGTLEIRESPLNVVKILRFSSKALHAQGRGETNLSCPWRSEPKTPAGQMTT